MLLGYLALIIGIVATAASILIATSASQLTVTAFSTVISLPATAAVATSWLAGACCLLAFRQLTPAKAQREKLLQAWEKQDVKLVAEIQSDEVKLLKAKIDTLEAALTVALKKKKES